MNSIKQLQKIPTINNFDILRFVFALLVLIYHACVLASTDELKLVVEFIIPFSRFAVPRFFIISGFLIFMSYETSKSWKNYFEKRARRILPAYLFIVILTAIGGCFVSTLPWNEYFRWEWFKYLFFNIIFLNFLHLSLPGVFESNPLMSTVNGSLWTIKVELMFYAVVPLLVHILRRYNQLVSILIIYLLSFIYSEVLNYLGEYTRHAIWFELAKQLPGQLTFFITGALIYYYYDAFKRNFRVPLCFSSLILVCSYYFKSTSIAYHLISLSTPISLAIVVIFIAFFSSYIELFSNYGDLSYGTYIYHFPLIQVFISLGLFNYSSYLALWLSVIATLLISYASWHLLEKPFLQRSHRPNAVNLQSRRVRRQNGSYEADRISYWSQTTHCQLNCDPQICLTRQA